MDPKTKTIDPLLTALATGFKPQEYIATALFPVFRSATQGGQYYEFTRNNLTLEDSDRARGSKTNEVLPDTWTKKSFYAEDHALKILVTNEEINQAGNTYDPRAQATKTVVNKLYVAAEVAAAAIVLNSTTMTQNVTLSGTTKWSNAAGDPVSTIKTGASVIEGSIGQRPNTLVMGREAFDTLMLNTTVIDKIKYSALGTPTIEILKALFEVDNIVIGRSTYNSAANGATPIFTNIWSDYAVLAYVSPTVASQELTLGYTFQYGEHEVDTWFVQDEKGEYIRDSWYYDMKLITNLAGYLIIDTK